MANGVIAAPPLQPSHLVDGNRLTLLDTGPRRLEALIGLIDAAERSVRVIYYIYVDDRAGMAVRRALIDAARRGVAVTLIVDGLGSEAAAHNHFFDSMVAAGIDVIRFLPSWGRRYLLRNHQKIVLADDARAIIGGFNVEDSYFGTPADQAWRDLGLLVDGPAAMRIAGYFDALAGWARRPRAPLGALRQALDAWSEPNGRVRWLFGGPARRLSPWALSVRGDLRQARAVDLISAYFAPGPAMLRRLELAGRRGRVRIVLASKNDHGAAIWASRFTYAGLLRNGVAVFEYQPTKLHTKLFVIDDVVYVGSANYDIRSLFLNLEMMLRIDDPGFAAHVRSYVDGEIGDSERITLQLYRARTGWWVRVKQAVAFFVITVLDYHITRGLNFGREPRLDP